MIGKNASVGEGSFGKVHLQKTASTRGPFTSPLDWAAASNPFEDAGPDEIESQAFCEARRYVPLAPRPDIVRLLDVSLVSGLRLYQIERGAGLAFEIRWCDATKFLADARFMLTGMRRPIQEAVCGASFSRGGGPVRAVVLPANVLLPGKSRFASSSFPRPRAHAAAAAGDEEAGVAPAPVA